MHIAVLSATALIIMHMITQVLNIDIQTLNNFVAIWDALLMLAALIPVIPSTAGHSIDR